MDNIKRQIEENPFIKIGEVIYQQLRDDIICLKLKPNQKVSEIGIAGEYNISRSPVKTAIDRLVSEKLLYRHPSNSGVLVTPLTKVDCVQICEARLCLEGYATALASHHMTNKQLGELLEITREFENIVHNNQFIKFVQCDIRFHDKIIGNCGNDRIIEMHNSLKNEIRRYRYYTATYMPEDQLQMRLRRSVKGHWAIYHALKLGFSDIARIEAVADAEGMKDALGWPQAME